MNLVRMVCLHCVYVIIVFAATLRDQLVQFSDLCCCVTGETMIVVVVMDTVVPLCNGWYDKFVVI